MIGDFKNSTKYAVTQRVDGDRAALSFENGEYKSSDGFTADLSELPPISSTGFTVEVRVSGGQLFVDDLLSFDGEDFRGREWNERYLTLKKEFDWVRPFYLSKHLVVKNEDELVDALELYAMLPSSQGAVVKPYHSLYNDETFFISSDEVFAGEDNNG